MKNNNSFVIAGVSALVLGLLATLILISGSLLCDNFASSFGSFIVLSWRKSIFILSGFGEAISTKAFSCSGVASLIFVAMSDVVVIKMLFGKIKLMVGLKFWWIFDFVEFYKGCF